jgi:hypothetical protein
MFELNDAETLPVVHVTLGKASLQKALEELQQLPIREYPYLYTLYVNLKEQLDKYREE